MPPPFEYTKCVKPEEYRVPRYTIGSVVTGLAAFIGVWFPPALWAALYAALMTLKEYLDHVLDGKLICLSEGHDQCVVGTVIALMPSRGFLDGLNLVSGDKFGDFDSFVDNDYGINLMLSPLQLRDFQTKPGEKFEAVGIFTTKRFKIDVESEQGLLVRPQDTAEAAVPENQKNFGEGFLVDNELARKVGGVLPLGLLVAGEESGPERRIPDVDVDVLHCEIEGSRGYYMRKRIDDFRGGAEFCKKNFLTKAFCGVLGFALAPITWAAVLAAAADAESGEPGPARVDDTGGELEVGDLTVLRGRWVKDADHGHHELHPVKAIYKVRPRRVVVEGPDTYIPGREPKWSDSMYLDPKNWEHLKIWQRLTCEVPTPTTIAPPIGAVASPIRTDTPSGTGQTLTAAQVKVRDGQARPENQWLVHPVLDGCKPARPLRGRSVIK
jgi:hypothetical protein